MKNFSILIAALTLSILIYSCSGNSSKNGSGNNDTTDSVANEETVKKDRLLPSEVSPDKAVKAEILNEAFYEWNGQEVLIAGYAKMYTDGEKLGKEVQLRDNPDNYDVLFTCEFKKALNKEVKSEDILIIKGKIKENSYWGISVVDCELVKLNGEYQKGTAPIPGLKQKEAFWVKDLYDAFNSWMGKEVTVVGHYNSTTTSTTSYGTTYRIDLDNPENGVKLVGCTMRTEPDSDKLSANRDNVKIRGKVTKDAWGSVQLEDCVIVE